MRKVLILSKEVPPKVGGAGVVALALLNALLSRGVDAKLSVLCCGYKSYLFTLAYAVYSLFFDLIILNDLYFKKVWVSIFRGRYSSKCIVYLHGSEPEFLLDDARYRKRFLQLCSNSYKIIAVSHYMKRKFMESLSEEESTLIESKIEVIHNGIDTGIFSVASTKRKSGVINVVTASRIIREKGYFNKAEIIRLLKLYGISVKWHIAGDGPDLMSIKSYIESIGISQDVEYYGALTQPELAELYKKCDVFMLLSDLKESLGLVYMEASCCGCIAIGRNQYGVTEAIVDSKTGYLVDNDSEVIKVFSEIASGKSMQRQVISSFASQKFSSSKFDTQIYKVIS